MNKRYDIISCPKCGAEYTAGELFIPNVFLGKPEMLDKDSVTHRIISDFGKPMNTNENYICDYCDTPFKISCKVYFSTSIEETKDFTNGYTSKIKNSSNKVRIPRDIFNNR